MEARESGATAARACAHTNDSPRASTATHNRAYGCLNNFQNFELFGFAFESSLRIAYVARAYARAYAAASAATSVARVAACTTAMAAASADGLFVPSPFAPFPSISAAGEVADACAAERRTGWVSVVLSKVCGRCPAKNAASDTTTNTMCVVFTIVTVVQKYIPRCCNRRGYAQVRWIK